VIATALLVVVGLAALVGGADLLVRAGSALAARLGIRPMIVGLTVVSIGTSVPELAVGIDAALSGSPGLAVGNIVGTNLVNLLLILGLSAAIVPIALARATLRFDLPAMTLAALLLFLLSLDGDLSTVDGVILLLGGAVYTALLVRLSRREANNVDRERATAAGPSRPGQRPWPLVLRLLAGLVAVVVGAELLVDGAVRAARSLSLSEAVIGLTVVAIGTSAPELVTTVVSTVRGDRDLAIGNLLGSSIYNIGVVLGLTVVVASPSLPVPDDVLAADLVLLVAATAAAVPVFLTGARISRIEGALLVATYVGYLTWLLVART
jgi:cation:H+ antiporter